MPVSKQYSAGFFDGEGSISIAVSHSRDGSIVPRLRVAVSNMDPRPLEAMQARWAGSLSQSKGVWNLCFNGHYADTFLRDVLPYLYVKKEAAQAAVTMMDRDDPLERIEEALKVCETVRRGYRAVRTDKTYQLLLQEQTRLMKIF